MNRSTAEVRALSASYWARVARRAWEHEGRAIRRLPAGRDREAREKARGPKPPADDLRACVEYLNSLDQALITVALQAGDYKTVHEVVEHARDRCLGRPKFEVEHGGSVDSNASGETVHRFIFEEVKGG